jgi:hypothetical protein
LAEKFAPAFQPHFRTQREKNIVGIAFAAAGNDSRPPGFKTAAAPRRIFRGRPPNASAALEKIKSNWRANFDFPRVHDLKFQIRNFFSPEKFFSRTRSFAARRPCRPTKPRGSARDFRRHFAVAAADIQNVFVAAQLSLAMSSRAQVCCTTEFAA